MSPTRFAIALCATVQCAALAGSDLIVGEIDTITNYAPVGNTAALSVGLTLCNTGDEQLSYIEDSPNHPVTTLNLYRIDNNFGIRQIGLSWVQHRQCAKQQSACGTCVPAGEGDCLPALGVGCSSRRNANFEGRQLTMSSRADINPASGLIQYPYPITTGDSIFKRLQYNIENFIPSSPNFQKYIVEAIAISPEDAASGNGKNNTSHREIFMREDGTASSLIGETVQELPAIFAWQEMFPDVMISHADLPSGGRIYVASRVQGTGGGPSARYQFAVFNESAIDAVSAFSMPVDGTNVGASFGRPTYHSGDPYTGAWEFKRENGLATWCTESFQENPNAPAARWGTMISPRYSTPLEPILGEIEITLFFSGHKLTFPAYVPRPRCSGDCNRDGVVDFDDLVCIIFNLGGQPIDGEAKPDCDQSGAPYDFDDVVCALFNFGPCPTEHSVP